MQALKINSLNELHSALKKIRKERKVRFHNLWRKFKKDLNQSLISACTTRIYFVFSIVQSEYQSSSKGRRGIQARFTQGCMEMDKRASARLCPIKGDYKLTIEISFLKSVRPCKFKSDVTSDEYHKWLIFEFSELDAAVISSTSLSDEATTSLMFGT